MARSMLWALGGHTGSAHTLQAPAVDAVGARGAHRLAGEKSGRGQ